MRRNPRWIPSSIDDYGLPRRKNSDEEENDFAKWLHNPDPSAELKESGAAMNCWEAVCAAAHYGGLIGKNGLVALFGNTIHEQYPTKSLLDQLGRSGSRPVGENAIPQLGDIIITDNDDPFHIGNHVFLSGGDGWVISHDNSDSQKGRIYNQVSGYRPDPIARKGDNQYMVKRRLSHMISIKKEEFERGGKGDLQIRYLSPEVFTRLP